MAVPALTSQHERAVVQQSFTPAEGTYRYEYNQQFRAQRDVWRCSQGGIILPVTLCSTGEVIQKALNLCL